MKEELKRVPLKDIVPDPNQPRKHFSELAQQELTDSIREHGVKQPVLLRPTKSKNGKYMIVAGERRFRSSQLAGLADIPAMIQDMSDKEALDVQITENLQRENINPMEEAHAFNGILKGKVYNVEGLAARIAKRPEYVRQRVRLCELSLLWQQVVYASKLRITDANLLCRFGEDQQLQFYNQYVPKNWVEMPEGWVVPPMQLVEKTKNLNKAPFKTEDPSLNPRMGKCGECPYNSAFSQLAFPGEEGNRICSNPACYHIKEQNSHRQKIQEAAKENVLLISGGVYSPQAKEEIKQAEQSGHSVLGQHDYEILHAPEHLSQKEYEKKYSWKVNDKPQGAKDEIYKEYEQEVANKEAEYNFKKQYAQKALVVASDYGAHKGEIMEVYVPQAEPDAITLEKRREEQILRLQRQKDVEIKSANGAFLEELQTALKESDAYWNNEKPLELKDTLAVLQLLKDGVELWDDEIKEDLAADWGKPDVSTVELLTGIATSGKSGFLYKWVRRLILESITHLGDAEGLVLRLLAERYVPKELDALQKQYKARQKEIVDSINQKIAELQQTSIDQLEQPGEKESTGLSKGLKSLLENVNQ